MRKPVDKSERVSSYLARAGIASRRKAEQFIKDGYVTVNGRPAVIGQIITPGLDQVCFKGIVVTVPSRLVYVLLNKPPGFISSCRSQFGRPAVTSLIAGVKERLFPVGRLDVDADGLLLLTNDGQLTYVLTHPKYRIIKEYVVEVGGQIDDCKIKRIVSGIMIDGRQVFVDYARFLRGEQNRPKLLIGVHEGKKHLVKKICNSVGYDVERLTRTKMGPLHIGKLPIGKWRYLTDKEVSSLYAAARREPEGDSHGT